jgi:CheY-like chemotaxis protein
LHGKSPFVGDSTIETVMLHRQGPIPSLRAGRPDVPEEVDRVFQRMVAKSPDDRYQAMADAIVALDECPLGPDIPPPSMRTATSSSSDEAAVTTVCQGGQSGRLPASVLLAEPSNAQALLIHEYLESHGVPQVRRCRTGRETLQSWAELRAEVVISAMHLDDMTGLELVRRLAADVQRDCPAFVLVSSSLGASDLERQARAMGVTLLAKPFDDNQLACALHEAVAAPAGPQ